jgi:nucleoside-diphosphate-sugar epimerase
VKGNLATMIRWIQRGWFPPVPETGNIRSMVDVRDLARALVVAATRDAAAGKVIIVTDGEAYSTRRLYNAIRHALGRRPLTWSVPVPVLRSLGAVGDALERVSRRELPLNRAVVSRLLDSACYRSVLAEPALDFRPRYRFESAVKEMVQSLKEG